MYFIQILRTINATPKATNNTGKYIEKVSPGKTNILGSRKIPPITIKTTPAERLPAISTKPTIIKIIGHEKMKWVKS